MIVEQIWVGNELRNLHYLVACGESGNALVIDPLDHERCLTLAARRGWTITQVVNTHEHHDHIGGNAAIVRATGAKLLAHEKAGPRITGIDRGLSAGDVVCVGHTVELSVLDTPGHTLSHLCLLSSGDAPALFSGDALFAAGAGNCRGGGDPEQLFNTFVTQFAELPKNTKVYPGHDYLENNLRFAIDREPDNKRALALLQEIEGSHAAHETLVTNLALEHEINPFFRLQSRTLVRRLSESFPDMPTSPSPKEVFLRLRQLRDRW